MEIVDNVIMLIIPGAMDAGLTEPLFWGSLIFALVVAGVIAFPANRWLIARGRGHGLVHKHHDQHPSNKVIAEEGHEYKHTFRTIDLRQSTYIGDEPELIWI
jgi:hypothetical protein